MVEKEVNMTVERDFDGKQQLAYCVWDFLVFYYYTFFEC